MRYVLTPREMASAEAAAVAAGVTEEQMMRKAGEALARKAIEVAGGAYGSRITIVCGKGKNAGDGFVAARALTRLGAHPTVVTLRPPDTLEGLTADMFSDLQMTRVIPAGSLPRELERSHVVIDSIVGTGLKGRLQEELASAVDRINASYVPVVSADVPSGIDALSGSASGPAIQADATVTMGALKTGLVLQPGAELAGEVTIADVGIAPHMPEASVFLADDEDVRLVLPRRAVTAHKRSVGKVLVVAGSQGMSGAAGLTALGAYRAGAGLVRIAVPASILGQVASLVPEALTVGVAETASGSIESGALDQVVELAATVDAVALGPGLGDHDETAGFVRKLLEVLEIPVVLDASGLHGFQGDPASLAKSSAPLLLTPHAGEMARLLGCEPLEVAAAPLEHASRAAKESGAIVLLKGQPTVVSGPGRSVFVNTGGPVLATAGTGDVLTGVAAALAARCSIFDAGWAAAWMHGRAGHAAARERSSTGVIARDVADAVPGVAGSLL